ncbi:MAG: PilZ domain-containing protein [Pseudomonadota bacterium]
MTRHLLFAIWLAVTPGVVQAKVDCDTVAQIERLHNTLLRLQSRPLGGAVSANLTILTADLNALPEATVQRALGPHVDTITRATMLEFITRAQALRPMLSNQRVTLLTSTLQSDDWATTFAQTKRAFDNLPCGPQSSEERSNDQGRPILTEELTELSPDQLRFRIKNLGLKFLAALVVAGTTTGLFFVVAPIVKRRQLLQRRLSKRFAIKYYTRALRGDQTPKVKVLNLSCTGAKVQYREDQRMTVGDRITVMFEDDAARAVVVWTNSFYFGVKFSQALPITTVRRLAKTYQFVGAANNFGATK